MASAGVITSSKNTGQVKLVEAQRTVRIPVSNSAAVNAAADTDMVTGQGIERDLFARAFATEDQTEGMAAFLEERPPEFSGR